MQYLTGVKKKESVLNREAEIDCRVVDRIEGGYYMQFSRNYSSLPILNS
jgi:hypothetical protein